MKTEPTFEELLLDYDRKILRRAEGCTDMMGASRDLAEARQSLLDREAHLRQSFQTFVDQIKGAQIPWETGTCCCGSPMEGHTFYDGHQPRDEGEYFMTTVIRDAERALGR